MDRNKVLFSLMLGICFVVGVPLSSRAADFADRFMGRMLLQVESRGEAWYVHPEIKKRHYLGDPSSMYNSMRNLSIGISNGDLARIPVGLLSVGNDASLDSDHDGLSDALEIGLDTGIYSKDSDHDGFEDRGEIEGGYNPLGTGRSIVDKKLQTRLAGRILLQVESRGEAWYLNPLDKKRYFLGKPETALAIVKFFGLGISNKNLSQIPAKEIGMVMENGVIDCGRSNELTFPPDPKDLKVKQCFYEAFKTCAPAKMTGAVASEEPDDEFGFEIAGKENGLCIVKEHSFGNPSMPNDPENRNMVCLYTQSKGEEFFKIIAGGGVYFSAKNPLFEKCTGALAQERYKSWIFPTE